MATRVLASKNDIENLNPGRVNTAPTSLHLKTQAAKNRDEQRLSMVGKVKPENDPFWNDRVVERDQTRAGNSYSVAIKANAVSKLLQPTAASLHGARKKVEEEVHEKKIASENNKLNVRNIESDCNVLRPTTASRFKKTDKPEPNEMSDEVFVKALNEFGNIQSKNVRGGGTYGFGLALPAPPAAGLNDAAAVEGTDTAVMPPTAPVQANSRLLVPTSASRSHNISQYKKQTAKMIRTFTTPRKAPQPGTRIVDPTSRIYDLPHRKNQQHISITKQKSSTNNWNSCTSNVRSLEMKTQVDKLQMAPQMTTQQRRETIAVSTFRPTVAKPFAVANKPTVAAAFRNVNKECMVSSAALHIMEENENAFKNSISTSSSQTAKRASMNGVLRPTAASVARRRTIAVPQQVEQSPIIANEVHDQVVVEAEVLMPPMPPSPEIAVDTEVNSPNSPAADVFFAMSEPEVFSASKNIIFNTSPKFKSTPKKSKNNITPKMKNTSAIKEVSSIDGEEFSMTEEEAALYQQIVANTVASVRVSTRLAAKKSTPKKMSTTPKKTNTSAKKSSLKKSPKASTPKAASPKGFSISATKTAKASTPKTSGSKKTPTSARKTTPKVVMTSTPMKSFDIDDITQDVAALLADSPIVAVTTRSGKVISPAAKGVPTFTASPQTPPLGVERRVTRSQL
jgi:hypothetical protein